MQYYDDDDYDYDEVERNDYEEPDEDYYGDFDPCCCDNDGFPKPWEDYEPDEEEEEVEEPKTARDELEEARVSIGRILGYCSPDTRNTLVDALENITAEIRNLPDDSDDNYY